MTLLIIANPHAGNRQALAVTKAVKHIYHKPIRVFLTRFPDDEKHQVKRLLAKYQEGDKVLIVGGDGTLSKTLYYLPDTIAFAYYPVGSGNDFAHALRLPNLKMTLDRLDKEQTTEITVFTYQGGIVLNSLDLGFAAYVVKESSQSHLKFWFNKFHLGKLTYILTALKCLFKNPTANVSLTYEDGEKKVLLDLFLCSLANNRTFGGGVVIWPKASALTPRLEIVTAKGKTFRKRLAVLLTLVLKMHQHSSSLTHKSVTRLSVDFEDDAIIEIDGEIVVLKHIDLIPQKRSIYF
ncbi:diacylglycerol/lipid kinase family protein [Streptococcus sciuri]|uniref:Diacylglycerol kinase n=1 Tax=Streptococcus sciuri TaxID=2973939 RepID=A0ABT2F7G7_9STRE|nr:diacylglycerol kinase family protein [Streptococcus sciuri]MCS4487976.1 diacylglycerol kinase [Streptococcus sciuri]